jgi:hypothetical protein
MQWKRRHQIKCANSQILENQIIVKVFMSEQTKLSKQDSQSRQRLPMIKGDCL